MASIGDGFRDIFLAGIGAMALTGEKAKGLVDTLISKGELTVEQGKQISEDLKQKGAEATQNMRYDALKTAMGAMTPEQREEFVKKAQEFAEKATETAAAADVTDVQSDVTGEAEILEVDDVTEETPKDDEADDAAEKADEAKAE